jgi:hypothetical protein
MIVDANVVHQPGEHSVSLTSQRALQIRRPIDLPGRISAPVMLLPVA